jgi:hypothetical protein
MIISRKHKFIFFKPMRVAGTTVEEFIRKTKKLGPNDIYTGLTIFDEKYTKTHAYAQRHLVLRKTFPAGSFTKLQENQSPGSVAKFFPKEFENYRHYSMTRNPFDVMVSYFWFLYNNPDYRNKKLKTEAEEPFEVIKEKFNKFLISPQRYRVPTAAGVSSSIILPSDALAMVNEEMSHVKNIIKFENIEEGLEEHFSYDGSFKLQEFKSHSRTDKRSYREYYEGSEDLIDIVRKSFPNTFKSHGYSF